MIPHYIVGTSRVFLMDVRILMEAFHDSSLHNGNQKRRGTRGAALPFFNSTDFTHDGAALMTQ